MANAESTVRGPKSQIPLRYLVRSWFEDGRRQVLSWSATSFEPVCDQLRTSFEPASVMEFGFKLLVLLWGPQPLSDIGWNFCFDQAT